MESHTYTARVIGSHSSEHSRESFRQPVSDLTQQRTSALSRCGLLCGREVPWVIRQLQSRTTTSGHLGPCSSSFLSVCSSRNYTGVQSSRWVQLFWLFSYFR